MMNTKNRAADRSTRTTSLATTAAVLCMLAGAPVGLAQSDVQGEDPPASGGPGSLMNFIGNGGDAQDGPQGGAQGGTQSGAQGGTQSGAQNPDQPGGAGGEFRTDGVYYDDNMTVELHVQDEALTDVLQMLSLQSERNIVASKDVNARVTANLYGVTFHEALDAILHVNGYGYIEKGNFIYVYPAEVLNEIEQASRTKEGHVYHLSFLSSVDAADFVTPLLSESGEIKTNGKAGNWTDPSGPTGNEEFASESTLIVYDFPENIQAIGDMLKEIDVRPAQILVEATIVQTALTEANAFGVDFSMIADFDYADFSGPLGAVDALVKGTDGSNRVPADGGATGVVSTPGNIGGPGTFKAGIVSNDVTVFLRMLQEVTSTTIISNPKVVTLNRQPGRVLVGRKVGYLQTTSTQTSSTQSVEFLDTGTQLNFRPFVMGDGIIRMELKPQVSEAQLRSATDATGAAVTIPDEVTNELSANVMVPDGHTIVLGGLFREATTASRRQVPVLGDIPILGTAFRGHDDDVQRQEIIFLITPSIVSDQVLVAQGLRAEESTRQIRAGSREGILPFSQERQAAQLLVEAEQLSQAGQTDRALHKVRRALQLNPANSQAIALREELVGTKDDWPTNSILEDIINGAAEVRKEHNIQQHGWKRFMGKASETGPTPDGRVAGEPAQRPGRHAAPAGTRAAGKTKGPKTQASNTGNAAPTGAPAGVRRGVRGEAANPGTTHADSTAVSPGYDSGSWWSSPEFDMFMTTWAVASAKEQNKEFDPTNRWWTTDQFREFFGSYQNAQNSPTQNTWWQSPEFQQFMQVWGDAAAKEQASGEGSTASADGEKDWWQSPEFKAFLTVWGIVSSEEEQAQAKADDSDQNWWKSPEFSQFMTTWAQASAKEQADAAESAWWKSPEFAQFMNTWAAASAVEQQKYAEAAQWWNSEAFKEFMAAFDTAVEKSRGLETPDGDSSGSQSPTNYTNVPSDNQD